MSTVFSHSISRPFSQPKLLEKMENFDFFMTSLLSNFLLFLNCQFNIKIDIVGVHFVQSFIFHHNMQYAKKSKNLFPMSYNEN